MSVLNPSNLPCPAVNLVFLPGWSFQPEVMQPLAEQVHKKLALQGINAKTQLLKLPANFDALAIEQLAQSLVAAPVNKFWLVGWSLGGMVAALLAQHLAEKCAGLVLMATNASFVSCPSWAEALPEKQLATFSSNFSAQPSQVMQRFTLLSAKGATNPKQLAQALQAKQLPINSTNLPVLQAGLTALAQLNIAPALTAFNGNKLAVLATADALIPATAKIKLAQLSPNLCVKEIAGSHALPFSSTLELAQLISGFITRAEAN